MADRIRLLPESVANQIAAGEVVNRPSSVVKEMMENAVDAGAKNITVNFRDGGKAVIQIVDDGCGMSVSDARLAFDRHATSKITNVEDIYSLKTFGFRGEALASIASVAEVELKTRQAGDELGTKLEIGGGKFITQSSVSCPVGSQFIIKNLFYNVPARRRFLEKSSTEARHIISEYQRVALCNPDIGFTLYDSDSLISKLPPSSLRQRVVNVIGKNIGKNLLDISADTSIVKIAGFAGRPGSAKQNNKEQFLFVNGRYFKSAYFHKAVVSAYDKLIPSNTQPSFFIYLTIDPERIDVNVHPQKTEVKFSDGSDMWQIINAAVRESLAKSGAVPPMDFDMDTSLEIPVFKGGVSYKAPQIIANPEFNPFERYNENIEDSRSDLVDFIEKGPYRGSFSINAREYSNISTHSGKIEGREMGISEPSKELSESGYYDTSLLEYIETGNDMQGELSIDIETGFKDILPLGKRYFATVSDGAFIVVDIKRAYESIFFDRYMMMLGNGSSVSQQLLFPERIAMSFDDYSLLKKNISDFNAFGFELSFPDEHTVEIHGIPADFNSGSAEELLFEMLDTLRDDIPESKELRQRKIASGMARLGSLVRSRSLSVEELTSLMEQLMQCSNPSYTPTGLTVMTSISEEEIRKRLE